MLFDIGLHLVVGPSGDRVDLHQSECLVERDERGVGPGRGLHAADAGDPGVVTDERALQRHNLAQPAAFTGVTREQILAEQLILFGHSVFRPHIDHIQAVYGRHRIAGADGLGEVVAGIQEKHVHTRMYLGGKVNQHTILHIRGDDVAGAEGVLGPVEQFQRRGVRSECGRAFFGDRPQFVFRQLRGQLRRYLIRCHASSPIYRRSASSARTAH